MFDFEIIFVLIHVYFPVFCSQIHSNYEPLQQNQE
jgi:hypothetical protein